MGVSVLSKMRNMTHPEACSASQSHRCDLAASPCALHHNNSQRHTCGRCEDRQMC